jgi:pseudoazurin
MPTGKQMLLLAHKNYVIYGDLGRMNRKKAIIAVLVHVALAVVVIAAVWPFLKGDDAGYHTKTSDDVKPEAVVVEPVAVENLEIDLVAEEPQTEVEAIVEEKPVVIEAVTEEVVVETAAIAEETATDSQVHIVTAQGLKYAPLVIVIALGDTVAWENMSSHDTQAMEGLVPEGSEMWHSAMGENFQRTFMQEGIYIYKCTPHWGAAMGGVIIVGKPVNLEAIKTATVKGAAKRLVKKAIQAAEAL